jgi:hypothetical protein
MRPRAKETAHSDDGSPTLRRPPSPKRRIRRTRPLRGDFRLARPSQERVRLAQPSRERPRLTRDPWMWLSRKSGGLSDRGGMPRVVPQSQGHDCPLLWYGHRVGSGFGPRRSRRRRGQDTLSEPHPHQSRDESHIRRDTAPCPGDEGRGNAVGRRRSRSHEDTRNIVLEAYGRDVSREPGKDRSKGPAV